MPSRVLIGAAGWLLGAVTATAGSLYAVDQLGQGLLAQHSKRVSVAMVNRELAQENSDRPAQPATHSPSASPSPSPAASRSSGVHAASTVPVSQAHRIRSASPSHVITTAGGWAEATCTRGDAYLISWSPAQGYGVHDWQRGPAPVASVTFTDSRGGVVLKVTCSSSGVPVKHISRFSWGGGSHHDE